MVVWGKALERLIAGVGVVVLDSMIESQLCIHHDCGKRYTIKHVTFNRWTLLLNLRKYDGWEYRTWLLETGEFSRMVVVFRKSQREII